MFWLDRIDPQIHDVWRGRWPEGAVEPPRILVDHELVFFSRGRFELTIGSMCRIMTEGSFVIIPPGLLHATTVTEGQAKRYCVHFDWSYSAEPAPPLLWRYPPDYLSCNEIRHPPEWIPHGVCAGLSAVPDEIESLFELLALRWTSGGALNQRICRAILLQVLSHLLSPEGDRAPQPDRATALALSVRQLLETADVSSQSVKELLQSLGFSYEHLCRVFKQKFGIPPLAYANRIRLERAKQLLQDPTLTVSEVAHRTGFRDPAYFSRAFRRYMGIPPSRVGGRGEEGV